MDAAAIAATEYLIDKLVQLVSVMNDRITDASGEVEQLTADLNYLNSFLKCASSKKIKDDGFKELLSHVRDAVHDAEDAVDTFFTQGWSGKWIRRFISRPRIQLEGIARQVYKVRQQVEAVYGEKSELEKMLLDLGDGDNLEFFTMIPKIASKDAEKNVVGLDKPTSDIIGFLKEDTLQLDIISIVGMPGIGKSTLAGKIFRDSIIQHEFPMRIWVNVSRLTPKDVFLSILSELTPITEDLRGMTESELAAEVNARLEKGKFLIVMDDVWMPEDWSKVSVALPTANRLIKIIITSRVKDVAMSASPQRPAYEMKLLEDGHSEQLLQYVVSGVPKWERPEIEAVGKLIAHECEGLPLAIVVMGGMISKKIVDNAAANVTAWKNLSRRVREHLVEDPNMVVDGVISLSYRELPNHLKPCFLYFGMFPEDFEIPTWKLFRMWIAEGFIRDKNSSLEETCESYLDELISRNLVAAGRRNSYGKVKSCRVHDLFRDFCKRQAGKDNENFLQEIRKSGDGFLTPVVNKDMNYRRLCIHSNISEFLASKPSGRRVRSFVCFSREDLTLEQEHISAIPRGFKLLRVLDAKPIRFTKIHSEMFELFHLRYLHLSFISKILPKKFSNFWNMQTLIVETPERTLEIRADMWKMRHLRHLKTSATAMLPQPDQDSAQDEHNIQTLCTISPEDCTEKILGRARNLRRVSIRGRLEMLLRSNRTEGSFDNIAELRKLEQLKLENSVSDKPASESPLPRLPPSDKFPARLKILTLKYTYLDWSQMRVLASLDHLEVLNLKERAFTGNNWATDDAGFQRLRVLFIGRTNLTTWKVSAGSFPNLVRLELDSCHDLRNVPIEFANRPSLRVLTLYYCPSAAPSTEEIKKLKAERNADFQVNVFPPLTSDHP